jgi:hypothetical protein
MVSICDSLVKISAIYCNGKNSGHQTGKQNFNMTEHQITVDMGFVKLVDSVLFEDKGGSRQL